jgi:hypothetical protein
METRYIVTVIYRKCGNGVRVVNIQTGTWFMAPECDTPSEVKRTWWGVLEKGQCLQGNIHYYGDYKNTSYSCTPIKDVGTEAKGEIEKK